MLKINNLQVDNGYNNTRKKKKEKSNKKTDMWKLYDTEINNEKNEAIECLYSKSVNDTICEICESDLQINM